MKSLPLASDHPDYRRHLGFQPIEFRVGWIVCRVLGGEGLWHAERLCGAPCQARLEDWEGPVSP
eukprot:SAG31_NODE_88_length_26714_cov_6.972046_11_plen_64_part_00